MNSDFQARVPTLWFGSGATHDMTRRLVAGHRTLVIADSAVLGDSGLGLPGRTIEVDASNTDVDVVEDIARDIVAEAPQRIVAIGGGTVLDAGKLAALALSPTRILDYAVVSAAASALTILPDSRPPVEVIAIPTTVGTSSETNSVAIRKSRIGFRLVVGRALRPRHAIIDSKHLLSLTTAAVLEGALEAFLRIAGVSTSAGAADRQLRDATRLGAALIDAACADPRSEIGRLRIARLSAATQRTAALRGSDPYAARHWYVANVLSFELGVRKMTATAAIISAVWRRACGGDIRWGDEANLRRFWSAATLGRGLPHDPVTGVGALLDRWGIQRPGRPDAETCARIAAVAEQTWGGRRPMLRDVRRDDVRAVLMDSDWAPELADLSGRTSLIDSREVT